ncbi:MAG TPA: hypothetical protein EYG11_24010 [Candidatus Latescibacteria bacterium]|nr:hypothetical protein [Candidatus Latescibacterota bacterium]
MYRAIFLSTLILAVPLAGDQLRITSSSDWREWQLPGDAVDVDDGTLKPSFVRRDINAVTNARDFQKGGIRKVGSNPSDALNLIDGDYQTSWSPNPTDTIEDWWIEVDLGRVVSAHKIELHFAADSTPLEFFKILTSDGEPFFSNANSVLPGTLRYNKRWRYSFNAEYVLEIDYELNPLKNIRIEADLPTEDVRLTEIVVRSIGDNISLGIWDRGGSVEIISEATSTIGRTLVESTGISSTLVDGDITTYWGTVHRGGSGTQPEQQIGEFEIDLGALYWVDRVRMLGDDSGIAPGKGSGRHRAGVFNYLWYRFFTSDGSKAPDGSLNWELMGELPSNPRNLKDIRHFQELFPLRKVRHVRLIFPMSNGFEAFNGRVGTTAEWQIFGEGYPAEVTMGSPIYDLGSVQHVSAIDWTADTPVATLVEIRSRTGNLLDEQYIFQDKNGKQVTEKKYAKLIPSFKGAIDTIRTPGADWSNWSRAYETSGQVFLSPGPRRYVQLDARILSEAPYNAATFDDIILEFNNPLAQATAAEVFPNQAPPGKMSQFTYYLRSDIDASSRGFDQIQLTSTAGTRFRAVRSAGETLTATVEEIEHGFKIHLDTPVQRSTLVEIDFESTLYFNQTRFDAFLFNSGLSETVRQPVDSGDAETAISSNQVFVSLPNNQQLFSDLSLSSPVLTPNGDGISDHLQIEFDLLKVLSPRPVVIGVYDLSGRQIALISDAAATASRQRLAWDGRDTQGRTVAPGVYILRISVEGDALTRSESRLISVAY